MATDAYNSAARTNDPLRLMDYKTHMENLAILDSALAGVYSLAGNDLASIANASRVLTPEEMTNLALAKSALVDYYKDAATFALNSSTELDEMVRGGFVNRHGLIAKQRSDYQEAIRQMETAQAALMSAASADEKLACQRTIKAWRNKIDLMNNRLELFSGQLANGRSEIERSPAAREQAARCIDAWINGKEIDTMKEIHGLTLAVMNARDLSGNAYERGMGRGWRETYQEQYDVTLANIEVLRGVSENDPSYMEMMRTVEGNIERSASIAQTAWTTSNQYLNMQLGNASDSALAPNYLNQSEQATIEGIVGYSKAGLGNPFGQRFLPRMPWQSVSSYAISKLSFTADDALVAPARPIEWNAPAPTAPTLVTRAGMTFEVIPEIREDKTIMVIRPYQMTTWTAMDKKQLNPEEITAESI